MASVRIVMRTDKVRKSGGAPLYFALTPNAQIQSPKPSGLTVRPRTLGKADQPAGSLGPYS